MAETNPLLTPSPLPFGAPAFDQIKTEHFMPALEAAIKEAEANVAAIKAIKDAPTFANTIEALETAGETLSRVVSIFGTFSGSLKSDELDAMEENFQAALTRYRSDLLMDAALFNRVKAAHDKNEKLDTEQKMLLEKTYKDFARSGALLDPQKKAEMREINERLSTLTTKFENNVVKATAAWKKIVTDEADLKGLPERSRKKYRAAAEAAKLPEGQFLIALSPPPIDIFEYAENRKLREEVYRGYHGRCYKDAFDNTAIALEIIQLRHRAAQLLGYPTHAAYVLDERMAKTPDTVNAFLKKNAATYRPAAEKFLQDLTDLAKKEDGLEKIEPWDTTFYARKLKEKTFAFDAEQLRPYFESNRVLDGFRLHAEKLFNIDFVAADGKYPVYHKDVKAYEVKDKTTGELIGLFYADYFARNGVKRGGAWMANLRDRAGKEIPVVTNTCNFDPPIGNDPALLTLDDVTTLYHEGGHALHALLAKGKYGSLNGVNVKWDFIELPSQVQENWVTEKEVLDTFAVHHETGEKMPAELIEKLRAAQNFGIGNFGLRQSFLGTLDQAWHGQDPANITSFDALEDKVVGDILPMPRVPGCAMSTTFTHIFSGGYDSGYYSYKWAEVLDADVFEAFKKNGLYDPATAKRLRETIYTEGGTKEPDAIFREMMGRDPDPAALFRREGITAQA